MTMDLEELAHAIAIRSSGDATPYLSRVAPLDTSGSCSSPRSYPQDSSKSKWDSPHFLHGRDLLERWQRVCSAQALQNGVIVGDSSAPIVRACANLSCERMVTVRS